MYVALRSALRPALALAALALLAAAPASAGPLRERDAGDLSALGERLPVGPDDPLAPFHFQLDGTPDALRELSDVGGRERLKAGPDTYEHVTLRTPAAGKSALPAPVGLSVVAGDFYFANGTRLVDVSLLLRAELGNDRAIDELVRCYGEPVFEVVLPGALDMILGWRTHTGFVLASFSDIEVFRVSVFRDEANDLLAGSQLVLFEGLSDYAQRLAAGTSAEELSRSLMKIVTWVAVARGKLEPVR